MSIEARKVLEALESSGKEGVGVITLSLETGYSQSELRSFFKNHKQYCVPLNGETKYKLSQFAYSVLLEQPFRFYLNTSDQRIVG